MRIPGSSSSWLSAVALLLLASIHQTTASPYPRDAIHDFLGLGFLMPRNCASYCGYDNAYCCAADQQCYTRAGIAGCENTVAGGGFAVRTTTWTSTETFTSTLSSYWPAATAASGNCVPEAGTGQIACGNICCANWQYCAFDGQCMPNNPAIGPVATTRTFTSGGTVYTTQYSAPYRPTGSEATATGTSASAQSTGTAVGTTTGTAHHLSGGAIAGIVIGVLAGLVLLVLICACCLVRGLWHGVVAMLGLGKKRHGKETIIEEERYTRHGSVHSRRDTHGGWFGAAGGRPSTVSDSRRSEKKKKSGGGWLGLGAAAGTLLLLLGLRRDRKRRESARKPRSEVSSSYWTEDYSVSSPSSASTRRTRDTRRSHRTQTTRVSRATSRR